MNWQEARRIAKRWVDSLQLESINGKHVDLRAKGSDLIVADPAFRAEIFRAAIRILKARGAGSWQLPE
jgi:hypothetical protein